MCNKAWLVLAAGFLFGCSPVTAPGGDGGQPIDAAKACTNNDGCSEGAPICDENEETCRGCAGHQECTGSTNGDFCGDLGACVECTEDEQCGEDTPFCGDDQLCRGCESNEECDSGACNFMTGSCTTITNVVYVNRTNGADVGTCTKTQACSTIGYASGQLAGTRRTLLISPGTYQERAIGRDIPTRMIGTGVTLDGAGLSLGNTQGLIENGYDATTVFEGFTVTNSQGNGAVCKGNGDAGLVLRDVRIQNSVNAGVTNRRPSSSAACDLVLDGTTIASNQGLGIDWFSGSVTLDGAEVVAHPGGAILTEDSQVLVENSLVTNNGSNNYNRTIVATGVGSNPIVYRYNTIAFNAPGCVPTMQFSTGTQPVLLDSNIIYHNIVECSGNVDGSALTNITNNIIEKTTDFEMYPTGNTMDPPLFADQGNGDLSLQATSPGVDTGTPEDAPIYDFNLDPRPLGAGPDIGAFESF